MPGLIGDFDITFLFNHDRLSFQNEGGLVEYVKYFVEGITEQPQYHLFIKRDGVDTINRIQAIYQFPPDSSSSFEKELVDFISYEDRRHFQLSGGELKLHFDSENRPYLKLVKTNLDI